uniref:Uncharacterized protein n=1 Tax=Strigamia maritima TaxID=126957 RepID=T1JMW1_STRMM
MVMGQCATSCILMWFYVIFVVLLRFLPSTYVEQQLGFSKPNSEFEGLRVSVLCLSPAQWRQIKCRTSFSPHPRTSQSRLEPSWIVLIVLHFASESSESGQYSGFLRPFVSFLEVFLSCDHRGHQFTFVSGDQQGSLHEANIRKPTSGRRHSFRFSKIGFDLQVSFGAFLELYLRLTVILQFKMTEKDGILSFKKLNELNYVS